MQNNIDRASNQTEIYVTLSEELLHKIGKGVTIPLIVRNASKTPLNRRE